MKQVAIIAAVFAVAFIFAANSQTAHAASPDTIQKIALITNAKTVRHDRLSENNQPKLPTPTKVVPQPAVKKVSKPTDKILTVKSGDYLVALAKQNHTTALRLFYANTNIKDPDLIYPGEKLRVPADNEHLKPRPVPANQQFTAPSLAPTPASAAVKPEYDNTPAPQPTTPQFADTSASSDVWDQIAACESGGNWHINTGNGFYGGLQFTLSSWQAVGGSGLPSNASRGEQIARAKILQARQGWGAWPVCSVKAGVR